MRTCSAGNPTRVLAKIGHEAICVMQRDRRRALGINGPHVVDRNFKGVQSCFVEVN